MKRKLMICAMALCICAGLAGNTGEVSVWASEGSSSDAVRIGALKGPTAMGMAQLLDEDGYDFTIASLTSTLLISRFTMVSLVLMLLTSSTSRLKMVFSTVHLKQA